MASTAHSRYAEILQDVENLVIDHIQHERSGSSQSKLRQLVPTLGTFFTPLRLRDAFVYQDQRRHMSSRRFVAPSFNDIRLILNTAQVMALIEQGPIELITFDGDVTLYNDGDSLFPSNPVIPRIINLLRNGVSIAIVTAAGYQTAQPYYERLHGLLEAIFKPFPGEYQPIRRAPLIVMGGEANYLYELVPPPPIGPVELRLVPYDRWALPEMRTWSSNDIRQLLDIAESALNECKTTMAMQGSILRKPHAVGLIPLPNCKFSREQLEETVLVTQRVLETSDVGKRLPFCAFNGGNDVFVDIGDKSWGVRACQGFFGGVKGERTLHVGDQFLSAGANDFKARLACTTAWIANPAETVQLLDEINELVEARRRGGRW